MGGADARVGVPCGQTLPCVTDLIVQGAMHTDIYSVQQAESIAK